MKKIRNLIFLCASLLVCLVPLLLMPVMKDRENTENRRLAEFPKFITEQGKPNLAFFEEFEDYFQDHFALRQELVYADALVQGKIFQVSSADNVVYGRDGWLYYRTTLGDYQGTNRMDEREQFALGQNLSLVRDYVESQGAKLTVAVPPNKNTLYPQGMPGYDKGIVDPGHTIDGLAELLAAKEINNADLLSAFRGEPEVLYLKTDSHWNRKGAMLAYRTIMDAMGVSGERYENVTAERRKVTAGDLGRMLYTIYAEKEMDYVYDLPENYRYVTQTESVEDAWIETSCEEASGRLLAFRDSFGNTLLPLLAGAFRQGYFTKEQPYRLAKLMAETAPDQVLIEKVERNLRDFLNAPPILPAPEVSKPETTKILTYDCEISAKKSLFDPDYTEIWGTLPAACVKTETRVLLETGGACYEAYLTEENGFLAYLEKDLLDLSGAGREVKIYTVEGEECTLSAVTMLQQGEEK